VAVVHLGVAGQAAALHATLTSGLEDTLLPLDDEFAVRADDRKCESWRSFVHRVCELAAMLGVVPKSVTQWDLPCVRTVGGQRYRWRDLREWLAARGG
jgi:hypothetical protein